MDNEEHNKLLNDLDNAINAVFITNKEFNRFVPIEDYNKVSSDTPNNVIPSYDTKEQNIPLH